MQTWNQKYITKHQWFVQMGTVILDTYKTAVTEMETQILNTWIMRPSLLPVLEMLFFCSKEGVSQYFCPYSVCTSHWCLVMSFWLKVWIFKVTPKVYYWD